MRRARGKARGRGPRFEPRVIRVIRSLNPRSELYDRVSRVRRQDPAGILRFCPPGLAVALILAIPPRPSFSLSAHPSSTLSLAPSPSLFHSHYGLPIFSPRTSLFFLLVASRSRRPHAGRDVTRPTRGRIQTSAFFFISR